MGINPLFADDIFVHSAVISKPVGKPVDSCRFGADLPVIAVLVWEQHRSETASWQFKASVAA